MSTKDVQIHQLTRDRVIMRNKVALFMAHRVYIHTNKRRYVIYQQTIYTGRSLF